MPSPPRGAQHAVHPSHLVPTGSQHRHSKQTPARGLWNHPASLYRGEQESGLVLWPRGHPGLTSRARAPHTIRLCYLEPPRSQMLLSVPQVPSSASASARLQPPEAVAPHPPRILQLNLTTQGPSPQLHYSGTPTPRPHYSDPTSPHPPTSLLRAPTPHPLHSGPSPADLTTQDPASHPFHSGTSCHDLTTQNPPPHPLHSGTLFPRPQHSGTLPRSYRSHHSGTPSPSTTRPSPAHSLGGALAGGGRALGDGGVDSERRQHRLPPGQHRGSAGRRRRHL